jgi:transcriptional regulator of arginine metabolism
VSEHVRLPQTKAARQARIAELVLGGEIGSQQELAALLADEGFGVTQGTLSRDLVDLGAVKVRNRGGDIVYALRGAVPVTLAHRRARLAQLCAETLLSAEASANLVIVKTPPGAAQYLASAVDGSLLEEVLGTIAGDDTILMVSRDPLGGTALAERLLGMSGREDKA